MQTEMEREFSVERKDSLLPKPPSPAPGSAGAARLCDFAPWCEGHPVNPANPVNPVQKERQDFRDLWDERDCALRRAWKFFLAQRHGGTKGGCRFPPGGGGGGLPAFLKKNFCVFAPLRAAQSAMRNSKFREADCAVVEGFADDAAVELGDFAEAGDVGCGADAAAGDELAAKGVDGVVDAFGFGEVGAH